MNEKLDNQDTAPEQQTGERVLEVTESELASNGLTESIEDPYERSREEAEYWEHRADYEEAFDAGFVN